MDHGPAEREASDLPFERFAEAAEHFLEGARPLHGLTKTARRWVRPAVAVREEIAFREENGREPLSERSTMRLLHKEAPDLSPVERRIAAEAAHAQGGPPLEPSDDPQRETVRRFAAVLDMARALAEAFGDAGAPWVDVLLVPGAPAELILSRAGAARPDFALLHQALRRVSPALYEPLAAVRYTPEPGDSPGAVTAGLSASDALARVVRVQTAQFFSRLTGLKQREDVEVVHEMRVALRRLRSALHLFRGAFRTDGDAEAGVLCPERLRAEMKTLADALGEARDADVFCAFLRKDLEQAPEADQELLTRLLRSHERRRRERYAALAPVVDDDRFAELAGRWRAAAAARPGDPAAAQRFEPGECGAARVAEVAPKILGRRLEKVRAFGEDLSELSPARLHKLRIACKKLRYAAEFLNGAYPKGLDPVILRMKRMQDALGEVHDCDVYVERLLKFHERLARDRESEAARGAVARLLTRLGERRALERSEADAVWGKFMKKKKRKKTTKRVNRPDKA